MIVNFIYNRLDRAGVGKLYSEGPHYNAQILKGPECAYDY